MSKQNREQNRSQRAAAIQAEAARSERNRRVAITGGILVVLAAIVAAAFWATSGGGGATASSIPKNLTLTASGNTLVLGKADAPVKVTVFEDFQCPFCKQFEAQSRDFLRTDAAEGKVQVTYTPINFLTNDDYSARALSAWAAVLEKGTPKQALSFHDKLFDSQPYEQSSDKPSEATFQGWAKDLGIGSSVRSAMTGVNSSVITAVDAVAKTADVQQTPTVLVDGKAYGSDLSVDDLAANLEKTIAAG
ncbi:MAG: oxidoreductase [Nocardioidaceae bacterium]|nr:oxidoreductase [Nocardioidaceae bacterium]